MQGEVSKRERRKSDRVHRKSQHRRHHERVKDAYTGLAREETHPGASGQPTAAKMPRKAPKTHALARGLLGKVSYGGELPFRVNTGDWATE